MGKPLRGLRAIRLSVLTDSTTSIDRQREATDKSAAALDLDFGEGDGLREAVDLDVSALSVSPFNRPQLGVWLARPDDFDAVVWWRFDRAIASMTDMHELAKWAREHRKMLVFDEGVGNAGRLVFDFRNPMDPMAELMMMLFAFAAQVERLSIKERVTGAHAAMRQMDYRWKGGPPPYGYEPKRLEGGGWTLQIDPNAADVLRRIIKELIHGDEKSRKPKSPTAIAVGLNADDVDSPFHYWAKRKTELRAAQAAAKADDGESVSDESDDEEPEVGTGKKSRNMWTGVTIANMLTDPKMLGWKTYKGQVVRKPETGVPVLLTATPLLSRPEYDQIGAVIKERAQGPRERKDTKAELLHVIICDGCGAYMYLDRRATTEQYKCDWRNTSGSCPAPATVKREWVEEYGEREFLRRLGGIRVRESEVIPGYDPEPEIEETDAEFKAHLVERGKQKSRSAVAAWQERHDALDARLAELEAREKVEPRTIVRETSVTYGQMWEAGDSKVRRGLLLDCGVVLRVKKGVRGGWRKLDESRVSFDVTAEFYADAAAELAALAEELAT
ncbi:MULTISPECIES: recombinase family protein [unclassified Streptomyces]|uniref:recombinase family protein n=1 Tax=unclassified Streptomyces TaxID=2593676 RepID=UPI0036E0B2D4